MGGAGVLRIRILHFFIRSRLCFSLKIRTNPYQLEALQCSIQVCVWPLSVAVSLGMVEIIQINLFYRISHDLISLEPLFACTTRTGRVCKGHVHIAVNLQ